MKFIRIGNAGGYWGDDPFALRRQVQGALKLNYISIDFLAEVTMSILQKQRQKDPTAGYAHDFVIQVEPLLTQVLDKKICIITNAGGVNPHGCAQALFKLAQQKNIPLRIAIIQGDDIATKVTSLHSNGVTLDNMESGEAFTPIAQRLISANAYFGALPVKEALSFEPHIVLCGRVTDTGITLGAMMHEFAWKQDEYNKLAHGIVAGHILECGAQATGGNFTDWKKVTSFIDVGFPIAECYEDGSFVVTKHPGTGGLVSCQTVREQLLYEMGHPQSYIVPDVIADFTTICLEQESVDRVKVTGVKGRPPTDFLKVSAAYSDGYKCAGTLIISGPDAFAKAQVFAQIFWQRLTAELNSNAFSALEDVRTEYVGADTCHGSLTPSTVPTEILLRLSARDQNKNKLQIFRKLLPSLILSGPSGVAVTGGAPTISDVVSYWPALIPQECALPTISLYSSEKDSDGNWKVHLVSEKNDLNWPITKGNPSEYPDLCDPYGYDLLKINLSQSPTRRVPLMRIAHARSGDKGNTANIGLIGRSPACYVFLRENITAALVKTWFGNLVRGPVTRHLVPQLWALNFLLEEALGGGGTMSLHLDAQGKTLSQALLRCEIDVPLVILESISSENAACRGELYE